MPYQTDPPTNDYTPRDDLPHHLQHKPVFALPYENFDGDNVPGTDARWMTVGFPQYDSDSKEISIKIMRHPGSRWSRQAEELPIHRPIDMTLFLAQLLFGRNEDGSVTVPSEVFPKQTSSITITPEYQQTTDEMQRYEDAIEEKRDLIKQRLKALYHVLDTLKQAWSD